MNDNEFAELLERERAARKMGWTSNAYLCRSCRREGKSVMGSTYFDWPSYYNRATNETFCAHHADSQHTGFKAQG